MGVSVQVRVPQTRLIRNAEYIIARFLVGLALSGRKHTISALYEYVVFDRKLSVVVDRYDISKHTLRHILYRLWRDGMLPYHVFYELLRNILVEHYEYFMGLEPIVVDNYCRLCRKRVEQTHVVHKHRDLVAKHTLELLEKVGQQ